MRQKRLAGKSRGSLILGVVLMAAVMAGASEVQAWTDSRTETKYLVNRAHGTLVSFTTDSKMAAFDDLIKHARGVFIAPQMLRGAFFFGASGGSGVFLVWDDKTRKWGGPAFYTIGAASFGLQIGGDASEVMLLAMTERGVKAMLSSSFKLGADAGVAAGPVGFGAAASTANLSVDILSFSRAKGLYGGVSVDGAVVATREEWNRSYYGKRVDPIDILVLQEGRNPQAAPLIEAIEKASGKKGPDQAKRHRSGRRLQS